MECLTFSQWLNGPARHRTGIRGFQICIGIATLFRCATEGAFASWLYGPTGLGIGSVVPLLGPSAAPLDGVYAYDAGVQAVVAVQAFAAMLLISGRAQRLGVSMALVCAVLLECRTVEINDGGDNLARLSLLYMLLLTPSNRPSVAGSVSAYLHNLGVTLLVGQVLILYGTAGLTKAMGEAWTHGTALYLIAQVDEFSLPAPRELFEIPLFTVAASYTTMLWQLTFPIAVFSRFKLAYIAVGVMFHLGIAGFMGLVTFLSLIHISEPTRPY